MLVSDIAVENRRAIFENGLDARACSVRGGMAPPASVNAPLTFCRTGGIDGLEISEDK
jgi:hypothetical protein